MKLHSFVLLVGLLGFEAKVFGQVDLQRAFRECGIKGSTTIYDYKYKRWIYSDSLDAQ